MGGGYENTKKKTQIVGFPSNKDPNRVPLISETPMGKQVILTIGLPPPNAAVAEESWLPNLQKKITNLCRTA